MDKRLIIVLAIISLVYSNCLSQNKLSGLQVGFIDLQIKSISASPQTYVQTFSQGFSSNPQIGISFHNFQITNITIKNMVIIADVLSSTKVQFYFDYDINLWKRVRIGYWASDRSDITLGQGIANLGSISGGTSSTFIKFDKPILNYHISIVRAYFTGIVINSGSEIFVHVYDKGLTANSVRINTMIGNKIDVQKVFFSYVIFSPQQSSFASYGGGFKQKNFDGIKVYDIHKIIYPSPYVFFGFIGFKLSGYGPFGYSSNVDQNLLLKLSTSRNFDQFTFSYVVFGNSPATSCSSCPGKYIYKNQCLNGCPTGSYPYTYRDNGIGCRTCPRNYNFRVNPQGNGCVCRFGFQEKNGYCQKSKISDNMFNNDISFAFQNSFFNPQSSKQAQQFIAQFNIQSQPSKHTQQIIPQHNIHPQTRPQHQMQSSFQKNNQQQNPHLIQTPKQLPVTQYISKDCSQKENTYWTGYRCACRVRYIPENGICVKTTIQPNSKIFRPAQFLYKISRLNNTIQCHNPYQKVQGRICICIEGYQRSLDGNCQYKLQKQMAETIQCPPFSIYQNGRCVCSSGYIQSRQGCIKKCPENSVEDGNGKCICLQGYYIDNGICRFGKPCPPYSQRNNQGSCRCIPGYKLYQNFCSRCPNGQIWVEKQNRCVIPCGINEELNYQTRVCQCKKGYGKFQGSCKKCPSNHFILQGYCVSCPLKSQYNEVLNQCVCNNGFLLNQLGLCINSCPQKQIFNPDSKQCQCIDGLGMASGQCIICPLGIDLKTKKCSTGCKSDEVLKNDKCVCINGYGYHKNDICINCSTISGGFEIDSYCATCPSTYNYNGSKCVCPQATQQTNGRCVASCQSGQILDSEGNCYRCPVNQIPVNKRCQCKPGYEKIQNLCQLKCKSNQVLINGLCGQCVLNTKYDEKHGVCVCGDGYYKNNYGYCQQTILPPVICSQGLYFDQDRGCIQCPKGCKTCDSQLQCTSCLVNGQVPLNNYCVPQCGDGIIIYGKETCDDRNKRNYDGCSSSCQIETGWQCYNTPSYCQKKYFMPVCSNGKIEEGEACDDNNSFPGDGCSNTCQIQDGFFCIGEPSSCEKSTIVEKQNKGMKLAGDILTNYNNVYIVFETDTVFRFQSDAAMRNFIKYNFPDQNTDPDSAYCNQVQSRPKIFQCLVVYASGLPNFKYPIQFTYNRNGIQGYYKVQVDPLVSGFMTRSLN